MRSLVIITILSMLGHKINKNNVAFWVLGIVLVSLLFVFGILAPHNLNQIDWVAISAIAVAITLVFVYQQAKTTEATLENRLRPSIDVGMIFSKKWRATRFQFINRANTAAAVWLDLKIVLNSKPVNEKELKEDWLKGDKHLSGEERIRVGFRPLATGATFLDKVNILPNTSKIEAFLSIDVAPLFDIEEEYRRFFDRRHYIFDFFCQSCKNKKDGTTCGNCGDWIDVEWWGIPDTVDSEILKIVGGVI